MAWPLLSQQQQYWLAHVQGCASSGLSMCDYADRHGFEAQEFYRRKRQLKVLGVLPKQPEVCASVQGSESFIRAAISPPERPQSSPSQHDPCRARISLANGITIDVPSGIAVGRA